MAAATGDEAVDNGIAADGSSSSGVASVDEMIGVPIDASCSSFPSPSCWEGSHPILLDDGHNDDNIISDASNDNGKIDSSPLTGDHKGDIPPLPDTISAPPITPDHSPVVASMMSPDGEVNTTNSSPDYATARPAYSPLADCLALAPTVRYWTNPQSGAW